MRMVAKPQTRLEQFCGVNSGASSTPVPASHAKKLGSLRPMRLVDISPCQPALAKAQAKLARFRGFTWRCPRMASRLSTWKSPSSRCEIFA